MAACTVEAQFTRVYYSMNGNAAGLQGTLELNLTFPNGGELLNIATDGAFTFIEKIALGDAFSVSVLTQPTGQECTLTNASGVMDSSTPEVLVDCVNLASIAGLITPANGVVTDTDVNDISLPFYDNSVLSTAQPIYHLATVNGFASADPTMGSPALERFAEIPDQEDFYRVTLEAGQLIQLHTVNHTSTANDSPWVGDLDLYLFRADDYSLVNSSTSETAIDEVIVPTSSEYLINVHAHSGITKYILRILPATSIDGSAAISADFIPNQVIVKYRDLSGATLAKQGKGVRSSAAPAPALDRIDNARQSLNRAMLELSSLNLRSFEQRQTLSGIKTLRQRSDVEYAEPNYIRRSLLTPSDPDYPRQWHYQAIGLPAAWDLTTGTTSGLPVVVAVVDSGVVLSHPDLSGQLVTGYDFISDAANARDGDGIDPDPDDPGDSDTKGQSSWHGTHVTGTVAAATDNNTGVAGVAWDAKIMPLRVLGKDGGSSYDVIQAVRYAAGLSNNSGTLPSQIADIINLSLGGPGHSLAEQETYQAVRAAGVTLVAAAGNENSSTPTYPAAYPEVLSVSATDYASEKAPYSNFGPTIAVAAPGGNASVDLNRDGYGDGVLSTAADDSRGSIRPTYRLYQGTSMAAPHVAGVIALMKSVYPGMTPDDVDNLLAGGDMTDDLGTTGRDDIFGHGLINAAKSVQAAAELAAGATVAEAPPHVVATPQQLDLNFSASGEFLLENQGGGSPLVENWLTDVAWLTVAPTNVDAYGLGWYTASVDRTGLADGMHQGNVLIELLDGSRVTIPVTILVDTQVTDGSLVDLRVFLLHAETAEIAAQAQTQVVAGDVAYQFASVRPGTYHLVAGSDLDADRSICQIGELCGTFGSPLQALQIDGAELSDLDFSAGIMSTSSPVAY